MKVKIQNRSVYHKFAEVEIEVDEVELKEWMDDAEAEGKYTDLQEYLNYNCHLYDEQLDEAMSKAEYVHGTGLYDFKGMDDAESDSEWRFECDELKTGGHL